MFHSVEYRAHFETFVSADAASRSDILIRRLLVFGSSLILWITLGDSLFAIWGTIYLFADALYVRLLRLWKNQPTPVRLVTVAVTSFLTGGWVGWMAVYLTWIDQGDYYFLAACIVVGQALHCLSSHARIGLATYVDLLVVSITTLGVTAVTAGQASPEAIAPAIIAGGIAVLIYFAHSVRKVVLERTALNHRLTSEVQDEKMRALGQFTTGVAHDFNNLLTVVSGNLELARLDALPEKTETLLDDAQSASRNAAALVKQLLAYSRKSNLHREEIPIAGLLERVNAIAGHLMPDTVQLRRQDLTSGAAVRADSAMLETSLLNLIINARDAVGGTGKISITAHDNKNGKDVDIHVDDEGPGMSPDVLQNATDPFFTTKAVGQGSGLGLSMVSGFAEQSGGSLVLGNRRGRGLRATIRLPRSAKTLPSKTS